MLRVPLQTGNREQPQKLPPAFLPRRATRRTIVEAQRGQEGVAIVELVDVDRVGRGDAGGELEAGSPLGCVLVVLFSFDQSNG